MKRQQKPTEVQAEIIRRAGLDPETVTVTSKSAALPLAITYHGDRNRALYWIYREASALRLTDTKPTFVKPRPDQEEIDDEANAPEEPLKTEKKHGKWRQTGKRAVSETDGRPTYNPDKLEDDLRRQGFSDKQARAMVAQVCDGYTIREAAKKVGLSHGAVGATRIQRTVKRLRSGKALPSESEGTPSPLRDKPGSKAIRLCDVRRRANELFKAAGGLDKPGPSDWWPSSSLCPTPSPETAREIVSQIRLYPGALLSDDGLFLLTTLVRLLEAANWGVDVAGWCGNAGEKQRDTVATHDLPYWPYVYASERKRVAKAARKILERLTKRGRGDSLEYPPVILTELLDGILERVAELQEQWKPFSAGRKESALAPFRENHAEELHDFNDLELRSLLDGDLLPAACRVAEKETGVSAETFTRYHRATLIRLREHPYADGRLAFARLLQESGNKT